MASIMQFRPGEIQCQSKMVLIRKIFGEQIFNGVLEGSLKENLYKPPTFRRHYDKDGLCVICELSENIDENFNVPDMKYTLTPIYLQAQQLGGLPLHSALIKYNGKGILIAGPSGAGKTTCFRRIPPPWKALCDDEVLVVRDNTGRYHAHPFPTWSNFFEGRPERSWDVQHNVPIKAIFFLQQAGVDEIKTVGQARATVLIYKSALNKWYYANFGNKYIMHEEIFNNAAEMAKSIPAFILRASQNGKFWEIIENAIE